MKCSDKSNCSRKKTYSPAFLRAYDSYRELLSGVSSCCADMGEEALTEFAEIIPEYAFQKKSSRPVIDVLSQCHSRRQSARRR